MSGGFRPTRSGLKPSLVFIAEEHFDANALARLGCWALLAVIAVGGAVYASRTELGARRVVVATANINADPGEPSRTLTTQLLARASAVEAQNRRLSDSLQALAADRDALTNKVTSLEQSLGDVTGSIAKLAPAQKPATPEVAAKPPAVDPAPAPPITSSQTVAPDTDAATGSTAINTQFGIDIGGALSMAALRTRWAALKAGHQTLLDGLRPIVSLQENPKGGFSLRLIAGPMANAAEAAKRCAGLGAAKVPCRPTAFDGQKLAVR
jgi:hypothetical protein